MSAAVEKKDGSHIVGDRVVDTHDGFLRIEQGTRAEVIHKSEVKSTSGPIQDAPNSKK